MQCARGSALTVAGVRLELREGRVQGARRIARRLPQPCRPCQRLEGAGGAVVLVLAVARAAGGGGAGRCAPRQRFLYRLQQQAANQGT